MSMSNFENPTSVYQLFTPALGGLALPNSEPKQLSDRADLITKVYTSMGIFSPEFAEKAPELLRAQPGILAVDSFVVVNLTPEYNLDSLMAGYNKGQKYPTTPWAPLWRQYTLEDINRRTVPGQGGIEPTHGEVRVHEPTTPENSYGEEGLSGTDRNITEQRGLIGNRVVMNLADYVLLQKLRQEEEEGRPPLDVQTFTRFPQMDFKKIDGDFYVGVAIWDDDQLSVSESGDFSSGQGGFRVSDGAPTA